MVTLAAATLPLSVCVCVHMCLPAATHPVTTMICHCSTHPRTACYRCIGGVSGALLLPHVKETLFSVCWHWF
jgi:hypothetical protein